MIIREEKEAETLETNTNKNKLSKTVTEMKGKIDVNSIWIQIVSQLTDLSK